MSVLAALVSVGSLVPGATPPAAAQDAAAACPATVPPAGFTDSAVSPFRHAIDCLVWWRIAEGRTADRFRPLETVTRRQMAIFLYRFVVATAPDLARDPGGGSPFRDVPDRGVGARENPRPRVPPVGGTPLLEGYGDGTFRPTNRVTRAQMASFVTRTVRAVAAELGTSLATSGCDRSFSDRDRIPPVHRPAVTFVCAQGIAEGSRGAYDPSSPVRRGQMAAFLTRSLDVFVRRGAVARPR